MQRGQVAHKAARSLPATKGRAMPLSDFSGIIPHEYSQQIIEEVTQQSTVLQLAQLLPMGTRISELPVPATLPNAEWITGANLPPGGPGRKNYTAMRLQPQVVTAEEIAAVVAIPDQYLEDNTINLWNWCRPRLAEAIAVKLDQTVLFGTIGTSTIPATFPAGGIVNAAGNAYSRPVVNGIDAVDGVNQAMSLVEQQGIAVTGHSADLGAKGQFRGVRDQNGSLLLGTEQVGNMQRPTLYGAPIAYSAYAQVTNADFITGAWQYLVIGVRQDIRFRFDPSGVIVAANGNVEVSGFQDNVTPCKVWARFGCTIIKPVTPRVPGGAVPFARVNLGTLQPAAPLEDSGSSRAKAPAK
jgi:HK97 family phage major capsid protein